MSTEPRGEADQPSASENRPDPATPTSGTPTSGTPTSGTPTSGTQASPASRFRDQLADRAGNQDDDDLEESIWEGGYSPKAMVGTWLFLVVLSIAILVGTILSGLVTLPIALGLVLLVWLAAGLLYAWRRLGVHYELTSQRFLHQTGILTRRTDRIELIDIDDVSFTQGPVERIFSVGKIVVTSSDRSHPVLSMIGIANVKRVAGLIDDARRRERRRRSLHIESI